MPTVLRKDGFRIMIFTNDHPPPHVHVFKGGTHARVAIGEPEAHIPARVIEVREMEKADARQAEEIVQAHQGDLLAKWRGIHGR